MNGQNREPSDERFDDNARQVVDPDLLESAPAMSAMAYQRQPVTVCGGPSAGTMVGRVPEIGGTHC
jgi:hypothetical protein